LVMLGADVGGWCWGVDVSGPRGVCDKFQTDLASGTYHRIHRTYKRTRASRSLSNRAPAPRSERRRALTSRTSGGGHPTHALWHPGIAGPAPVPQAGTGSNTPVQGGYSRGHRDVWGQGPSLLLTASSGKVLREHVQPTLPHFRGDPAAPQLPPVAGLNIVKGGPLVLIEL